ncbi:methyltransferase-like protein 27 [Mugil cephalus]|uniref:methyltransferase-like protein 27 n=1 Tax=Mugil cephalus TaxID=48193 RepID=UPI001FB83B6C|nr:methyltransferase-like protein 27 [Mugil cephalus]
MKTILQTCRGFDIQAWMNFYDSWAETYEQDVEVLSYRAPQLAVDFLDANFCGIREEVQVLDVACGSGLVAKLMSELGFKHFVGVDGSKGMLDQAEKNGLYRDLKLALLGPEPLPAQRGAFDVVILVGALDVDYAPVSVVRELCSASKPGGFICMSRKNHVGKKSEEYKQDLERELQLMEEEGLWSPVGIKQEERYMMDVTAHSEEKYVGGNVYLYKKSAE